MSALNVFADVSENFRLVDVESATKIKVCVWKMLVRFVCSHEP